MPRKGDSKLNSVKDELIRFYAEGNSLAECGVHFGQNHGTIKDFLIANGVKLRSVKEALVLIKAKDPSKFRVKPKLMPFRDEVIARYLAGETPDQIGKSYGISYVRVSAFLKKQGVPTRDGREAQKLSWQTSKAHRRKVADPGPYLDAELRSKAAATVQASFDFMSTEPTKRCPRCEKHVPRSGWTVFGGGHASAYCKRCFAAYARSRPKRITDAGTKAIQRAKMREYVKGIRREALVAYGGKCACCGEGHHEFLAIDHIHGGGNRHRAYLHANKGTPSNFFHWLRKNGFPEGFRVLCHSCNLARQFYGYCPHEEARAFLGEGLGPNTLRNRKIRLRLIEGYGGRCVCCSEAHPEFLALDHTDGGGAAHRRELKAAGVSQYQFIRGLIAEGFPPGFRILCHSCNAARGFYGYCPHESGDRPPSGDGKSDVSPRASCGSRIDD